MKNRIKALRAQITESILELGHSPISVSYADMDDDSIHHVLDDVVIIVREAINNAFIDELNS